jgi:hypothetical protein
MRANPQRKSITFSPMRRRMALSGTEVVGMGRVARIKLLGPAITRTLLWLYSLDIFDKNYAKATAGSSDEHAEIAPDLFTTETPLGTYQGSPTKWSCRGLPPPSERCLIDVEARGRNIAASAKNSL